MMRRRPMARTRARGLTLIEVMMVLVVLAIVGVLAAPSFVQALARGHLRGAAGEAYADMQFARAEAVQRNAAVLATFSGTGWTITQGGQTLKAVTLNGGTAVSSGATMTVTFDPVRATATVANGPVVLSHTATSSTLRLTVSALGRVEICAASGFISGFDAC